MFSIASLFLIAKLIHVEFAKDKNIKKKTKHHAYKLLKI